jgi:hypothetical protein
MKKHFVSFLLGNKTPNIRLGKSSRYFLLFIVCCAGLFSGLSLVFSFGLANTVASNPVPRAELETPSIFLVSSSEAVTNTTYLPALSKWTYQTRSLGQVSLISGPNDCLGEKCYTLRITCPGVTDPISGTLKVGGPSDSSKKGTILLASGYTGSYYWEGSDDALMAQIDDSLRVYDLEPKLTSQQIEAINTNNRMILDHLQADGFQTLQIKWENKGWYMAKAGQAEGQAHLSCRSATLASWVYTQFHQKDIFKPYCAVGHSNGASQVSYSLAQYGEADILSAVVLESGPNWSRIDYACLKDPDHSSLFASDGERNEIDKAFGGSSSGSPCKNQLESFRSNFEEASLLIGNWRYVYPRTMVAFVFGGLDNGTTRKQGDLYYDLLAGLGTPLLSKVVVPNAEHYVTQTVEGMQAVEDAIRNSCTTH